MNLNKLLLRGKIILLPFIPKDSGNLVKSIRSYRTPRGFRYVSLGNQAPYNVVVNRGRRDRPLSAKERANVNYWKKGATALETYFKSNLNTGFDNESFKSAVAKAKTNAKTEAVFNRSIPKVGG